jgi:NAD(P)-dependent dehydrogenase (short-subunit alcohol dehydrogenase family)
MKANVLVIIGAGGIGQAIARRQGAGMSILLADINEKTLEAAAKDLRSLGNIVTTKQVDVTKRASVHALAEQASRVGNVMQVAHTAGISPNMASGEKVLEEFGRVIAPNGAGVIISSMAGYMLPSLSQEQNVALALTPTDDLLKLPFLAPYKESLSAYSFAKRANHLRVQAETFKWAERGARINSISPGIILTALAQHELDSPIGAIYKSMIEQSAAKRMGTPDETANIAAYLLGNESSFVTGSDFLIDGGVIAAMQTGRMKLPV